MSNTSLRQQAYDWIKKQIITLELQPGSALSEIEISRELGLGRTPVREAIQRLKGDDLIVVLPRKGTFVSNINLGDFEKLIDARLMLECHVVKALAAPEGHFDLKKVEQLRHLFDSVPELAEKRDIDALLSIDRKFHQELVALLDNPYLMMIADRVYDLVTRTWHLSFNKRTRDDLLKTAQDHIDIIDAIVRGDVQGGEDAVRKHIFNFRNKVYSQY